MSNVVIRELEPRDDLGFRHIRAMVYRNGDPVKPEDTILPKDCIGFVGELNGEIVSAATVIDMTASKGVAALRCAGIAAVGVLPERRRAGVGGELISKMTPLLREQGFSMASLYPFRAVFYGKYGYAHCGKRYQISCPAERLPRFDTALEPRQLPPSEWREIVPCYEQFASRYAGMNLRTEVQWTRALGRDNPFQIYVVGDPVEAYAVLRLDSEFWTGQTVKEFVWSDGRGYRSILTLLRSLGINKTKMTWNEPGDSPFYSFYMDQGVDVSVDRSIMYRILDVPAALSAVVREESGEFCFRVNDRDEPENDGVWQVCFGPDGTRVERGGDPDFEIGIGALTQAFLGEPSFERVLSLGFPKVLLASGVEAALRFFAPAHVHCMDFF